MISIDILKKINPRESELKNFGDKHRMLDNILYRFFSVNKLRIIILFICSVSACIMNQNSYSAQEDVTANQLQPKAPLFYINNIIIHGNTYVPQEAIINVIPEELTRGRVYQALYTNSLIRNIFGLGYFKQIHVLGEQADMNKINLHIVVEEKKRLSDVIFKGNKNLTEEAIKKKISFNIPAVDDVELHRLARKIEKLYREKDYHAVKVTTELKENDKDNTSTAIFNIDENKRSFIKRVFIKGNKKFSDKVLRKILFTREDWLLSFADKAGTYQPEAIEMDKHNLENFYQNHGYLNAKVADAIVFKNPQTNHYEVTFIVEEGDQYRISDLSIELHEQLSQEILRAQIPLKAGDIYSREKLTKSMEILRLIWGEFGYIFAEIIPSVEPDHVHKTVTIGFKSQLGEKVNLRRLTIKGNRSTRDKVIRRQIILNEGELLTKQRMEDSKNRVELLGFFDKRDGVNYKITRITDTLADLDLMVKEVKTGKAGIQIGVNPIGARGAKSTNAGFGFAAHVTQPNLFGKAILLNLQGNASKDEYSVQFSLANPWLFDRPLYGGLDFNYSKSWYEEIKSIEVNKDSDKKVAEQIIGGSGTIGYYSPIPFIGPISTRFQLGIDHRIVRQPIASKDLKESERQEYQGILNRRFFSGNIGIVSFSFGQDARNHPMHPTQGYQWGLLTKLGFSEKINRPINNISNDCSFGFYRIELNATWFTPLIDDDKLYLGLRSTIGFVRPIFKNDIPFSELYSLGGPTSVRGFDPTEISPRWKAANEFGLGNVIGGTNAFSWTAELMFPITQDFSAKGYVFYDGGACWRTPDAQCISSERLRRNDFFYRHSVGIGVRLLKPTPITIDWGFKLNPQRKLGEEVSQFHFSMYRDF